MVHFQILKFLVCVCKSPLVNIFSIRTTSDAESMGGTYLPYSVQMLVPCSMLHSTHATFFVKLFCLPLKRWSKINFGTSMQCVYSFFFFTSGTSGWEHWKSGNSTPGKHHQVLQRLCICSSFNRNLVTSGQQCLPWEYDQNLKKTTLQKSP